ncbi:MAG TPA: replication factor C large subunit [Methanothrix sp.]|jgi:replication factor C large subunit|uniref:replication factor C large subunit n=1 Tax=Methanothrix sp. TaxID=90426 RepID=UPI002CE5C4CA|nr:replication factor C large subunit [Methanothrix sp.]MDI9417618.1 replication factor C large subunit [Euryarchaeota archaeon]HON34870.1 replication factor C large subunit [Methanothrix sp.]HRU74845.1 replication factor C large subunit [Methanothrix sp.]
MPAALKWTEKYRPASLKQVLGNGKAVDDLREWALSWERGEPIAGAVILYGPAGTGKTSAALALARDLDWDYIEMNASDARTAGMIERIAVPASRSQTFSGKPRLVILDEADNLHGTADRGGAAAMLRLVRETLQPVILIANEYYEIDKTLRDATRGIQFRSVRSTTIAQALREICRAEGIDCDPDLLVTIAQRAGGDMRSAVNDLQAAAEGRESILMEDLATAQRDVKSSIFRVLEVIYKGSNAKEALEASYTLDESPEDLINWVDENLPLAYSGQDLLQGYESLARSDIFLGRVRRRQNYGLWRYASYLMTGGVQAAKRERRHGYVAFRPPSLWRRMGQTRKARSIRDSAARKIGRHCHVSLSFARSELMDFVGMLLRNKKSAPQLAAQLELTAEEVALLLGSSPGTKKVQGIIDEAVRIQSREQIEKIELAWRKSGQAADDPGANGPEGRDGPSKRDGQARAERKNGSEPAPSPEKRQKSLFDF